MADHVDEVKANEAVLSSVKEGLCQEDTFMEDKAYIFETAITTDNMGLHGPIRYDEIKQEVASYEGAQVQNDNVTIEGGISADDIKIEIDNGLPYCEQCEAYYVDYCIECRMLVHILNKNSLNSTDNGAQKGIPNDILEIQDLFGQTGIYALRIIPAGVKFGPFIGLTTTECPWEMKGEKFVLDKIKSKHLNWMQYINPTRNTSEQNLSVFRSEDDIYYQSTRQIQAGDELLVYFGEEFGNSWTKIVRVNFSTTTKDIVKDIFACTFCCLGFRSKSHLVKHKTICVEAADGKFSIEDGCDAEDYHKSKAKRVRTTFTEEQLQVLQANFQLDSNPDEQDLERIMQITGLSKRVTQVWFQNSRVRQKKHMHTGKVKTQNGCDAEGYHKSKAKRVRTIFTEEQLQVLQANFQLDSNPDGQDLERLAQITGLSKRVTQVWFRNSRVRQKKHMHTGKVKTQKLMQCPFCKIRLDRKEYFEHHMAFCCERNARKRILPTPPANQVTAALNERKRCLRQIHKCEQCKYRTKYQAELKEHIKQHNKIKIYKCGICDRRFMTKETLRQHVENTHANVEKTDNREHSTTDYNNTLVKVEPSSSQDQQKIFKCSHKRYLRTHIKSKHSKKYDYKCDSCDFETNQKNRLAVHIKSKHLKEYDYKCQSCEYRTNLKRNLELHIKTNHLKQFDYKCYTCKFGTNFKRNLELHIKTNHLKQFDYKCDTCKYGTNLKRNLETHIKTNHLKQFDYKCESCEFRANTRSHLKIHIKTKHLKKFDHKCGSCEFVTNNYTVLNRHVKTKHLKQFDFKCDSCEFGANNKNHLEVHIKTKHLKKFDYKCDSCEYGTNRKNHLVRHIKAHHLKTFDYICGYCEYGVQIKTTLEKHIKTQHLKQFDYKCEVCGYKTNHKSRLESHMKRNHL